MQMALPYMTHDSPGTAGVPPAKNTCLAVGQVFDLSIRDVIRYVQVRSQT